MLGDIFCGGHQHPDGHHDYARCNELYGQLDLTCQAEHPSLTRIVPDASLTFR